MLQLSPLTPQHAEFESACTTSKKERGEEEKMCDHLITAARQVSQGQSATRDAWISARKLCLRNFYSSILNRVLVTVEYIGWESFSSNVSMADLYSSCHTCWLLPQYRVEHLSKTSPTRYIKLTMGPYSPYRYLLTTCFSFPQNGY